MQTHLCPTLRRPVFQPQAIAAAAALMLACAVPAHAQSFGQGGANSTSPNNLLPFAGAPTSLNFGNDAIYVGNSGLGSFSAQAGAVLNAGALTVATGGTGVGTVTFSGAGTKVELGANTARLDVGSWGSGTLTVSAGALLDASLNGASCSNCFNVVGNGAGSTGTLTISGVDSEVRVVRNFSIGQSSVFTGFGTPGGTTRAFVNVQSGGTLSSERASIGTNNASPPNALGTERAFGTVVVSGAGSQWLLTRNIFDNTVAGMSIGTNINGDGRLTVNNGGTVRIDGTGAPAEQNDFINLGTNGGYGELTVSGVNAATGAASRLDMVGFGGAINVGRSGTAPAPGTPSTPGTGSFSVQAGATVSAVFFSVGRDRANGTAVIDGAGSQLLLSGEGTYSGGGLGAAGGNIGWAGTGEVTVSRGGLWSISDGGTNNSASNRGPHLNVGFGNVIAGVTVGGNGSLFISGTGSRVELTSTSLSPAVGSPDNGNPSVNIGRDIGSTGIVDISAGGKLLLTGNALSTPDFERTTYLGVGGNSNTARGGTGFLNIDGAGSEVRLNGTDAYVAVGFNGTGVLAMTDGASLAATAVGVGRASNGSGSLTMDASTMQLSGQFTNGNGASAGIAVGSGGGTGTMVMSNSSVVTIENLGSAGAGLSLGGSGVHPLGTGTLTMTDSQINVVAVPGLGGVSIGRTGTGVALLDNSTITNTGGNVYVGREVGSSGTLILTNGSVVNAAYVSAGTSRPYDGTAHNGGSGVILLSDSTINAGKFELGAGGLLMGNNGTLNVEGDVVIGGTISPGESPGRMRIRCNIIMLPGSRIVLEISGSGDDLGDYEFDQLIIGDTATFDLASAEIVFSFLGATDPTMVSALGGLDLNYYLRAGSEDPNAPIDGPTQALSSVFAPGQTWGDVIDASKVSAVSENPNYSNIVLNFDPDTGMAQVVAVPEPSTWGMLFFGLAAVGAFARRRQAQAAAA